MSHSEPIVEGPAAGKHFLGARIADFCTEGEFELKGEPAMNEALIRFAKFVMPF